MGTDQQAIAALARTTGVSNPLKPRTPDEKKHILQACADLPHVGDRHLSDLLSFEKKEKGANIHNASDSYEIPGTLVKMCIRAYMNIYLDIEHPLHHKVLLVIHKGTQNESALLQVRSTKVVGCKNPSPLIVPNQDGVQLLALHYDAAAMFRKS